MRCLRGFFSSSFLFSQSKSEQPKPPVPSSSLAREFPVTMRQKVVAGKTPVGTKVEANLTIATLVDGKVIPMGATFSGEVVDSAANSATRSIPPRHPHERSALEERVNAHPGLLDRMVLPHPDADG